MHIKDHNSCWTQKCGVNNLSLFLAQHAEILCDKEIQLAPIMLIYTHTNQNTHTHNANTQAHRHLNHAQDQLFLK